MSLDEIIENMSIEEKVGQMFQVGFQGKSPNQKIKDLIKNHYIGGVIYFSRNLENPSQTAQLSNELQEISLENNNSFPLFISIDQEGGIVTRLKESTHFPGNMLLGATRSEEIIKEVAKATANELKNLGINMNLAPVVDVNNNPENPVIGVRSFGEDPKLVAKFSSIYIKKLEENGVIACAKHFPGHGDTDLDSHLNLPVIKHSRERLDEVELLPFKEAIKAGVDSIMSAHVYFPAIEKQVSVPATLSRKVLTSLLREELAYKGVIVTDCMEMNAIADSYGSIEGAVQAISAGSDIILISHSYKRQKRAIKAAVEAVKANRIQEQRINQSVKRILKLKEKRISLSNYEKADYKKINFAKNKKIAENAAKKGITVVKGEEIIAEFAADINQKQLGVLDFEMGRVTLVENDKKHDNLFVNNLKKEIDGLKHITLTKDEKLSTEKENSLAENDVIIVCTYDGVKNRGQLDIAEKLARKNKVIVLALRNPYDYNHLKNTAAFVTTYDYSPANQEAAANLFLGKIKASGKLPVSL
ncbi:MAG: beta-N-acetylhexosaminidase [Bacillota bacterium]